jgi:hypothetical protein
MRALRRVPSGELGGSEQSRMVRGSSSHWVAASTAGRVSVCRQEADGQVRAAVTTARESARLPSIRPALQEMRRKATSGRRLRGVFDFRGQVRRAAWTGGPLPHGAEGGADAGEAEFRVERAGSAVGGYEGGSAVCSRANCARARRRASSRLAGAAGLVQLLDGSASASARAVGRWRQEQGGGECGQSEGRAGAGGS